MNIIISCFFLLMTRCDPTLFSWVSSVRCCVAHQCWGMFGCSPDVEGMMPCQRNKGSPKKNAFQRVAGFMSVARRIRLCLVPVGNCYEVLHQQALVLRHQKMPLRTSSEQYVGSVEAWQACLRNRSPFFLRFAPSRSCRAQRKERVQFSVLRGDCSPTFNGPTML